MKIPLFPLDVVLFPGAPLPLHIFEPRYRELVGECLLQKSVFGVVRAQREGLAVIGCTASIVTVINRYSDGRLDILCEGTERFEIELLDNSRAFLQAEVDMLRDEEEFATRAQREECVALHFETLELVGEQSEDAPRNLSIDLDRPLSFQLAAVLPADLSFKQNLLTLDSDLSRTECLLSFYNAILPKLRRGAQASRSAGGNGRVM
jgi:Lon protease-like protein